MPGVSCMLYLFASLIFPGPSILVHYHSRLSLYLFTIFWGRFWIVIASNNQISFDTSAGIWAGMHTVRYFDGKTYEWVGISRQPNIIGKVCFELIILDYSFLLASLLLIDTNLWFPIVIPTM